MPKFRKKPVVVEAFLVGSEDDPADWFNDAINKGQVEVFDFGIQPNDRFYRIKTLEGFTDAYPEKHYVIKGVKEEIYACRKDIFEQTYEPVEENK